MATRYAKPGEAGGKLIREVIGVLRTQKFHLPLSSDILIAVSAGSDSMALAHLLVHYGRRVSEPSRITLLHLNHGWRGMDSDADATFVAEKAKEWGVACRGIDLKDAKPKRGESWEDVARKARKMVFADESRARGGAPVFTAHHADDLAETVLWRLFTGAARTHGGGIAWRHGPEIRPLLRVRKNELRQYLHEEGEGWREDSTNYESKLLRARMRQELMPALENLFPAAVDKLGEAALSAQAAAAPLIGASGLVTERQREFPAYHAPRD